MKTWVEFVSHLIVSLGLTLLAYAVVDVFADSPWPALVALAVLFGYWGVCVFVVHDGPSTSSGRHGGGGGGSSWFDDLF